MYGTTAGGAFDGNADANGGAGWRQEEAARKKITLVIKFTEIFTQLGHSTRQYKAHIHVLTSHLAVAISPFFYLPLCPSVCLRFFFFVAIIELQAWKFFSSHLDTNQLII